jgi:RNA polymerase sigma factor (sigma-70 family)
VNASSLLSMLSNDNLHRRSDGSPSTDERAVQVEALLSVFDGESSLKHLFWELLSYDRVREPLPLSFLPPATTDLMINLEVFAATDALTVIYAVMRERPDGMRLEQMCWALKRHITNCVVLLHDSNTWTLVYPDESTKPRVRLLPLPGPTERRAETARALTALDATDAVSGSALHPFELAENLDTLFPGAMPNLGDLFNDFERIRQHSNPEVRDLLLFIREAGKYPLLTPAQERGEDITGGEVPPDGTELSYYEWRLIVCNLRLVLWMARRCPRVGMDLADLVQEGTIGLMTAARRFDPALGNRFTTYAFHWIRQSMFRGLHNGCNLIRWPVWIAPKLITACIDSNEDGLSAGEKPVAYVPWRLGFLSLHAVDPVESALIQETKIAVRRVLWRLKPLQEKVIARRFGIGLDHEYTLEEIGQEFGLTRERIRQIEADALKKLGKAGRGLLAYHEASEWRISGGPSLHTRQSPSVLQLYENAA